MTRFKSEGADIAIIKEGGGYRLYDYESGHITRIMSEAELDELVQNIRDKQINFKEQSEMQRLDKEIGAFAEKNIPEYKNLTASEREVVRETLRFAREYGASRADQILYGRISAKSGLAIHLTDKVPGGDVAFFDGKNTIYLDANAPRTRSYKGLLGHEVWHKMFKSAKVRGLFLKALDNIDPGKRAEVKKTYIEDMRQSELYTEEEIANISDEEVAAAYAEELFNNPHVWDIVLDGEPTLKDRVLAFFKLAPKKYSFAPEIDAAAKEWIREYKKVFDQLASENANKNTFFGTKNGEQNTLLRTKDAESADSDNVETAFDNKDGRSALDENLGEQLNEWIANNGKKGKKYNGVYFRLGTTPNVFVKHGAQNVEMIMYDDVVAKVTGMKGDDAHVISLEEISKLPSQLNDPILLFKGSIPNSFVAITELVDKKGHDVVVAVHINRKNGRSAITKIASMYSKTNENGENRIVSYVNNQIKNGNLIDASAKKAPMWFTTRGLQLPKVVQTIIDANVIILQNSQNDKGFDKNSSKKVDSGGRAALADGKKETSSDVAAAKKDISEAGIDPRGIMALSDSYFDRYDGSLTRTGLRYEFLDAARTMLQSDGDAYDRAFAKIEAIAEELTLNERDGSGFVNDLKEIQRHIREITFEIREQDKGEFDSLGGFNEFRKKHFGKLNIANEGASVDSVYGELQTLYGLSLFPDQNTSQEMLIRISEVLDMDPKAQAAGDIDLKAAGTDMAVELTQKIVNAFENKLAAKAARMSKADAEAYKARINAKAEVKAAKAIAKAKKRLEALAEKMKKGNVKLEADYKTDTVFSQAAVDRALNESKALGSLPEGMKKTLSEEIFLDMNESLNEGERYALRAEYTVKIMDAILGNEKGEYFGATVMQRTQLRDEVSDMMRRISEAGKASKRAKMADEVRGEVKVEEAGAQVAIKNK